MLQFKINAMEQLISHHEEAELKELMNAEREQENAVRGDTYRANEGNVSQVTPGGPPPDSNSQFHELQRQATKKAVPPAPVAPPSESIAPQNVVGEAAPVQYTQQQPQTVSVTIFTLTIDLLKYAI